MYNESLHDLLDEASVGGLGPRPRLQVKEDAHSRVFVAGLSEARPQSSVKRMLGHRKQACDSILPQLQRITDPPHLFSHCLP